ncbi:alkaline phosphatase [Shewanella sp. 6_MG-2023]|uniref:alkaline phosphatase D family protein n=1 Tax=Shewanella sp. 6_MG-2023 TaxID=3062660 RepID=UPI0026E3D6CA|nr:alkaline phosphatase D family protein [Shewanella sp. 6_MG-2023]MDO6620294.1 alkaline phosphatase D family protein [Shewanella sp. 6_MG-2023]
MKISNFKVGPILGSVTKDSAHIFGRGKSSKKKSSFGVYRFKEANTTSWSAPIIRYQQPHFDYSSVCVNSALQPATRYEYQSGYILSSEGVSIDPEDLQWDKVEIHNFKTPSDDNVSTVTFAFGSCRYLLKLFMGSIFDSRGDKVFGSMVKEGLDQVLMLGDQIYADDLNIFGADDTVDEYLKRYRDVFSQPNFSKLVSSTATYMTLDDHEIEDNWPSNTSKKDWLKKYPAAMHAYKIYQMSHSPAATLNENKNKIKNVGNNYWYKMTNGCCDFFVMDVRTQRIDNKIINDKQLNELLDWLDDGSGRYKFIATSVPFFPDYSKVNNDKWSGYQEQRNIILDFISDKNINKVVFLSGDVHASMAAELTRSDNPEFKVTSIVSSPFFWPYPHPNNDTFQMSGQLCGHEHIYINKLMDIFNDENYAKISASPNKLEIEIKSRKGKLIQNKEIIFENS